jgi:transcriptional regulator with XRE-family HTH domain
MPQTPKRAGRTPHPEARFPSQVLAANVRILRGLRKLNQEELAARMNHLRHQWTRATVSEVERGDRNVTVDELASLCVVLGAWGPGDLLDPERQGVHLDLGMTGPLRTTLARDWAQGRFLVELVQGDQGQWQYAFEEPEDVTTPEWLFHRARPEEKS